MPLDQKYIEELVFKFQQGSIAPQELETLLNWYNKHDDTQVNLPLEESRQQIKQRMLQGLLERSRSEFSENETPGSQRNRSLRWLVAAAILLIVGVGSWMLLGQKAGNETQLAGPDSIQPGGNKATLMLSDGQKIKLNTDQNGIVVGADITYSDGTALTQMGSDPAPGEQLTLHTPRGGMYQVQLSDGTRVWLNSESVLSYPLRFSDTGRVVELKGEAYFEVQSLKRADGTKIPFRVRSAQQEILVLGTEFNISAYPGQTYTKTTLIEGRVLVKNEGAALTLKPGQQATTEGKQTSVQRVEPKHFTAWKDGKFSFDGKSFQDIMTEIGRWYDLRIVYENGIPNEEIAGDAFRNQDLKLVLRLLDAVAIDYTLDTEARKLIIKGKKQIGNQNEQGQ